MVKSEREYRSVELAEFRTEPEKYIVEGYASTFERYELFDGIYEQIERSAFDGCDMSDCVFLLNHTGRVFARTKNGTVSLSVDDHGLKVVADLSKTAAAREMWEDIHVGNIDQMSFAFTIDEDEFDKASRTRIIKKIGKLYDTSAVTFPANPTTEISARDYCNGVIAAEQAERLAAEQREKAKARIRILMEV